MDEAHLIEVLRQAHGRGYAQVASIAPAVLTNGAKRYQQEWGDVCYEDIFAGGNPFVGWELLSARGQPLWAMTYYGRALVEPASVFAALRAALRAGIAGGEWCRGPAHYRSGTWRYRCKRNGSFGAFTVEESLALDGREVYRAWLAGGYVDQQPAL
ncbi:MAG: DUF5680 domain-containing protein [Candidatus Dormibacteria bacterium]